MSAQSKPDFGLGAPRVDEELQSRIEAKLTGDLKGWNLTRRRSWTAGVLLSGKRAAERLDIETSYMVSVADAARRLSSYQRQISIGAGNHKTGVGQEALYMVYWSDVILRFRQRRVVVEVFAFPDRRSGPFDDGLWKQREKLVFEATTIIENEIRSGG